MALVNLKINLFYPSSTLEIRTGIIIALLHKFIICLTSWPKPVTRQTSTNNECARISSRQQRDKSLSTQWFAIFVSQI